MGQEDQGRGLYSIEKPTYLLETENEDEQKERLRSIDKATYRLRTESYKGMR